MIENHMEFGFLIEFSPEPPTAIGALPMTCDRCALCAVCARCGRCWGSEHRDGSHINSAALPILSL